MFTKCGGWWMPARGSQADDSIEHECAQSVFKHIIGSKVQIKYYKGFV